MQDPYGALVALVRFDDETRLRQNIGLEHEKALQSISKKLILSEEALEEKKASLRVLEKRQDEVALELRTCEQEEARIAKRLDTAGRGKEFEALAHERQANTNRSNDLEVNLEKLWDDIAFAEREVLLAQENLKHLRVQSQAESLEHQKEFDSIMEELNRRKNKRDVLLGNVLSEWVVQYEQMRTRMANPFVPVVNGCCGGCGSSLSRVDSAAVERHQLVVCQTCRRMLYDSTVCEGADATQTLG